MPPSYRLQLPGLERLICNQDFGAALAAEVERRGARRVMTIASRTLAERVGLAERLRQELGDRHAALFTAMPAHSPRDAVLAATAAARNCDADLIAAIGGSSVVDGAKMVRLCLGNEVRRTAELDPLMIVVAPDGSQHVPLPLPPRPGMVAVPTTLSAAEYAARTGSADPARGTKDLYLHPALAPDTVILDPALTRETPDWLWFSTGVRAVDHAVEALCGTAPNAAGEAFAGMALRLLASGLRQSRRSGDDLAARHDCQVGAFFALMAAHSGLPLGASHGISHALGAGAGVPHGYTSCVLLPAVLRFNLPSNRDRQALVSGILGAAERDAADLVEELVVELGLPRRLRDCGVGLEALPPVAERAMHDKWIHTNPRRIAGPEDILRILQAAY